MTDYVQFLKEDYWPNHERAPNAFYKIELEGNEVLIFSFWETLSSEILETIEDVIDTIEDVFYTMTTKFPILKEKLSIIILSDENVTAYGDPNWFANGQAYKSEGAIVLYPQVLKGDFRKPFEKRISALEGTLIHEMGHMIEELFSKKWKDFFFYVADFQKEWQLKPLPWNNSTKRFANADGEIALLGMFPYVPKDCVSEYAKIHWQEDICESLVAYIVDKSLLKAEKAKIIEEVISSQESLFILEEVNKSN